jgi:uncharacterized protein YecE (DUF72 family)
MIRIGICSFADEGLLKHWYPRGVSTPARRLAYYSERFDAVEVDSPFYHLPAPEVAGRWAERTPSGFVFHVKAGGEMTGHRDGEREPSFRAFREALDELAAVRALLDPLVPLIEFRHRSWLTEEERADTLAFLERHGLAYVSADSPRTRASNVIPPIAAASHPVAYVRFHGRNWKTWNIRGAKSSAERFDWLYSAEELQDWVEPLGGLAAEADEVYAMFNNNRADYAPRSATTLRGLLDEAGLQASGGLEPAGQAQLELDA